MINEVVHSKDTCYQIRRIYVRENKSNVCPTVTANMGTGGHNVPLILSDHGIRKLTPRETFNIQGFPKDFKLPEISNAQLYKQAGNSVVVPVIKRIAENIANALELAESKTKIYNTIEMNNKNILIYVDMKSRFEGESFVQAYFDEVSEANDFARTKEIPILSDEEYLKLVKRDVSKCFYSLQEK